MPLIFKCGRLGSGKTLDMTREVVKYYRKGYNIYANYTLHGIEYTHLNSPLEILEITTKKNVIALDEVYLWFDCYIASRDTLKLMRNIINASRKKDMIIIGTTQSIDQVSYKYRSIVDSFDFPQHYPEHDMLITEVYTASIGKHSMINSSLKPMFKIITKEVSKYFPLYDSWEVLQDFDNVEDSFKKKGKGKEKERKGYQLVLN